MTIAAFSGIFGQRRASMVEITIKYEEVRKTKPADSAPSPTVTCSTPSSSASTPKASPLASTKGLSYEEKVLIVQNCELDPGETVSAHSTTVSIKSSAMSHGSAESADHMNSSYCKIIGAIMEALPGYEGD